MVEDIPRSGRLSTANTEENVEKVTEIVLENRHTSLRKVAREFNFVYRAAKNIVVDILGTRRVAARLIPKDLNFVQKHYSKTVAEDLISQAKKDPTFIKWIITRDKT